uniref:Ig-like domain-containing protein n=1 Tax=Cyprinodon variegatus TaxID=28743 RepID=A0A3Q2D992_CYPVA
MVRFCLDYSNIWDGKFLRIIFSPLCSAEFPIITVQLGEPVTLTCFPENLKVVTWVYWYKQSAGNTLELIAKVHKSKKQIYEHGFQRSRFKITYNGNKSTLTILSSAEQDEGMYHCGFMDWSEFTWTGTYLSVRGKRLVFLKPKIWFYENGLDLDYAALHFSGGKEQKSKKKREQKTEESVYSQVIFNSNK